MNKQDFFDYCQEYIIDHLSEYEGQEVSMCDLGLTLTEGPNIDGTLTYSTADAKEYLREWWDDAAEYWDYEKFNFGQNLHNPFDNPEAYMVCMVIEGVRSILSQCETVDEYWNDKVTLNDETIKVILSEVQEVTEIKW